MSNVPDVEIDIATIQKQNELRKKNSLQLNFSQSNQNGNGHQNDSNLDPQWNFEISEWDETCLKEASAAQSTNFTNKIFEHLNQEKSNVNTNNTNKCSKDWLIDDMGNPKTLFIDPNDMDFFGDDFDDTDLEDEDTSLVQQPQQHVQVKTNNTKEKDTESLNSNDSNDFADENYDEIYEEEELKLEKFTIDMNTLKADMKMKSAKLISKLSVNSNNCSLVKSLVKTPSQTSQFEPSLESSIKSDFNNFNLADEITQNLDDLQQANGSTILEALNAAAAAAATANNNNNSKKFLFNFDILEWDL
jgi:hypothetical protein